MRGDEFSQFHQGYFIQYPHQYHSKTVVKMPSVVQESLIQVRPITSSENVLAMMNEIFVKVRESPPCHLQLPHNTTTIPTSRQNP